MADGHGGTVASERRNKQDKVVEMERGCAAAIGVHRGSVRPLGGGGDATEVQRRRGWRLWRRGHGDKMVSRLNGSSYVRLDGPMSISTLRRTRRATQLGEGCTGVGWPLWQGVAAVLLMAARKKARRGYSE